MTAGYSGTPLPKKLGITVGSDVLVLGDPMDFDLTSLGVEFDRSPDGTPDVGSYDVVLLFAPTAASLGALFEPGARAHRTAGAIWVCWPKKSSGLQKDLTENDVREYGLDHGQVDVKVAAIDSTFSGLKFVTRVKDR